MKKQSKFIALTALEQYRTRVANQMRESAAHISNDHTVAGRRAHEVKLWNVVNRALKELEALKAT